MAKIDELPIGTRVLAPAQGAWHPAVIEDRSADSASVPVWVEVRFTPPVPSLQTAGYFESFLTCSPDQVVVRPDDEAAP